jgi:hypothetical protein
MPLINCPECKNEISDSALKCPKCGVQLRKPTRSFFGKIIKWTFIGFNILMIFWFVGGMNAATEHAENLTGAAQAGAAIGTGLGAAMILGIWGFGDFVLGLFLLLTRPKG